MPPDNPTVARAVLNVQRDTRAFANVLHLRRFDGAVLNLADLQTMATTLETWWTTDYRASVVPNVTSENVTVTKLDPDDPIQWTDTFAQPGTAPTPEAEPGNVTAAFSWRTGLAGRKHRGRSYHVGVDGDQINTNDTFTGGYLAILTAVAAQLLSRLTIAGLSLVIFHRIDNTFTTVTSVVVDQLVDSMRTRLAGRGV